VEVVVIAQDAQGAQVARPWVEKANGTYRALLDQRSEIGKACGLKYVPVGIVLDEEGRLARPVGSVSIDDENFRRELGQWAQSGSIPPSWREMASPARPAPFTYDEREALARFELAVVLLERGEREEAIAELRRAVRLDPQNWLIRKQLWAVHTPEAFYSGPVDYAWQKQQMEKEAAELLGEK
jgi:tetratricopeptide (TPR) repeat protein